MESKKTLQMIKWSSSLNIDVLWKPSIKLDRLMPPFLQWGHVSHPVEQKHAEVPGTVTDIDSASHIHTSIKVRPALSKVKSDDRITMCRYLEGDSLDEKTLNLPEGDERKFYVPCVKDCRTHDFTCEELRDRLDGETNSFGEITELHDAHEHRGEDYQGWEKDFEEDETDRGLPEEKTRFPWSLELCGSFSSFSEAEEDPPNTTDPYLSHKSSIPYRQTPRPRYFQPGDKDIENTVTSLPRRPRSPVRDILPDKFDLKRAYEEWSTQRQASETRKCLIESKNRISESMKRLSVDKLDGDALISSVVLQRICEEITLAVINARIIGNVDTFINVAMIWALADLNIFNSGMLTDGQSKLCKDLGLFDRNIVDDIGKMGDGGMHRTLLGVYRPPFTYNVHPNWHRRLPWPYVSPSHEKGHPKLYPNVRERIEKKLSKVNDRNVMSIYVLDLKCFHLREVLDRSYVAYNRKSISIEPPALRSMNRVEDLFMELMSFT